MLWRRIKSFPTRECMLSKNLDERLPSFGYKVCPCEIFGWTRSKSWTSLHGSLASFFARTWRYVIQIYHILIINEENSSRPWEIFLTISISIHLTADNTNSISVPSVVHLVLFLFERTHTHRNTKVYQIFSEMRWDYVLSPMFRRLNPESGRNHPEKSNQIPSFWLFMTINEAERSIHRSDSTPSQKQCRKTRSAHISRANKKKQTPNRERKTWAQEIMIVQI